MFALSMLTIVSSEKTPISYNLITQKSIQYFHCFKGNQKMETTMQEKLIQFILNLTDEECEMIVSHLMQEEGRA